MTVYHADLILTIFTIVTVMGLVFVAWMGARYLLGYGEPPVGYQSTRQRENKYKDIICHGGHEADLTALLAPREQVVREAYAKVAYKNCKANGSYQEDHQCGWCEPIAAAIRTGKAPHGN